MSVETALPRVPRLRGMCLLPMGRRKLSSAFGRRGAGEDTARCHSGEDEFIMRCRPEWAAVVR